MCFSATASFGASVVLTATGIVTRSITTSPMQKPFASVPFIFGVQQFTEGVLWTSFNNPTFSSWQVPSTYLFLIFAQIIWPLWVPFAIMKMEENEGRKKILISLVGLGTLVSSYLAYCLFMYPVQASIIGNHIHYEQHYPLAIQPFSALSYFAVTVASMFVSSVKHMALLGVAILASLMFTLYYHAAHLVSIWCFLAAMISIIVFYILLYQKRLYNAEHPVTVH
jgi:hypothetical protein